MKNIKDFENPGIKFVFCDIDDTLTNDGQLGPHAYQALWDLNQANIQVIPVTGRPAGWCEMIARFWPVSGIVGENGGFYFRYKNNTMVRHFTVDDEQRKKNQTGLEKIKQEVLETYPQLQIASDQFCRLLDLAVDFNEDVKVNDPKVIQGIVGIFKKHGAVAKVSSIHVNGWFGNYDKKTMVKEFAHRELNLNLDSEQSSVLFVGDSPNDEPMFEYFDYSFAVANIKEFIADLKSPPKFVMDKEGGDGFVQLASALLNR